MSDNDNDKRTSLLQYGINCGCEKVVQYRWFFFQNKFFFLKVLKKMDFEFCSDSKVQHFHSASPLS
jgi:hypothetical protein